MYLYIIFGVDIGILFSFFFICLIKITRVNCIDLIIVKLYISCIFNYFIKFKKKINIRCISLRPRMKNESRTESSLIGTKFPEKW